jgi:hypothetical protein
LPPDRGPDPLVNEWVELGDGEPPIWADFVWRDQRVIVETDGRKFHKNMNRPRELEPTIARLVNG